MVSSSGSIKSNYVVECWLNVISVATKLGLGMGIVKDLTDERINEVLSRVRFPCKKGTHIASYAK
jgi:hypothetical protein